MRARLALVFAAVTSMVTIAFLVPLALVTRTIARDHALTLAERDTRAIAPVLALSPEPEVIESLLATTTTGADGRLSVRLPDGTVVGAVPPDSSRVDEAARTGRSGRGDVRGGVQVDTPVALAGDTIAVVSAFVPSALLTNGVGRAWLGLGLVGLALVVLASLVAVRLARTLIRPVNRLAEASALLGAGDLTARVTPEGPPELVRVSETFNRLVGQVESLLVAEREAVADLAHRLRTPLTALRIQADDIDDPEQARRLVESVDRLTIAVNRVITEARHRAPGPSPVAPCVVAEVVRERIRHWTPLLEDLERPFDHDVADGLVAHVDPDRLAGAIDLLIENVLQHTPDEAPVIVRAGPEPAGVAISVEDGGPGFPASAVRRGVSGSGSTGLGLDIVRHVATAAGGSLEIGRSVLGGARVTMHLPS